MSLLPRYRHIINPKLKHTYLTFDEGGDLIIKSPKVSQHYIEKLLIKKSSWINRSREKLMQKKDNALDYSRQTEIYFHGKAYPLILSQQAKKRTELSFENGTFILRYHRYNETLFQKHIDKFYKKEASAFIPAQVEYWASETKLTPNRISFRKTKRQWGSCSGKNDLSFNTMAMKLPLDVIQYIIVHELAHIKHKHHQKSFWSLVEKHMPDYRQHVAELKTYSTV